MPIASRARAAASSSAHPGADQRVHDGVELARASLVGEHKLAEPRPVQRAVRPRARSGPNAATTSASPRCPGRPPRARSASASMIDRARRGQPPGHLALARPRSRRSARPEHARESSLPACRSAGLGHGARRSVSAAVQLRSSAMHRCLGHGWTRQLWPPDSLSRSAASASSRGQRAGPARAPVAVDERGGAGAEVSRRGLAAVLGRQRRPCCGLGDLLLVRLEARARLGVLRAPTPRAGVSKPSSHSPVSGSKPSG